MLRSKVYFFNNWSFRTLTLYYLVISHYTCYMAIFRWIMKETEQHPQRMQAPL